MTLTITKKNHKVDYNSLLFISKALPTKEDSRYTLNYVQIQDNRIAVTDGHRLHMITDIKETMFEGMPAGMYKMIKTAKDITLVLTEVDGTFPNIDNVIPDISDKKPILTADFNLNTDKKTPSGRLSSIIGKLYETALVNYDYIKDLTMIDTWDIYAAPDLSPVTFNNCKHTAIIMPMRKDV